MAKKEEKASKTKAIAKGFKGVVEKYNSKEAHKHAGYSAMKMLVDMGIGGGVGTGLGAVSGVVAPWLGILLMGVGHYSGDKTGLIRVAGATCLGYGVAKMLENRAAASAATVSGISLGSLAGGAKQRLISLKDEWKHTLFLDKLMGSKTEAPLEGIGQADLSELDVFENLNREAAIKHELKKIREQEQSTATNLVIQSPEAEIIEGLNYAVGEEVFETHIF
ncbi:MAG: hypothetical protein HYZ14_15350 [Bacteroidetes bacterium]|nr:hypothetical protein [Bacteroidota bacterium]